MAITTIYIPQTFRAEGLDMLRKSDQADYFERMTKMREGKEAELDSALADGWVIMDRFDIADSSGQSRVYVLRLATGQPNWPPKEVGDAETRPGS